MTSRLTMRDKYYDYEKSYFEFENSELLQYYILHSSITKIHRKDEMSSSNDSFETLDVMVKTRMQFKESIPSDREIVLDLMGFLSIYEQNHLKRSAESSKTVQKYLALCELPSLYAIESVKNHVLQTAADMMFDNEVKNSDVWVNFFRLVKNDLFMQEYILNVFSPEKIGFFLKQLRLGGCLIAKTDFPLNLFGYDRLPQLHVFLQHTNSLRNEISGVERFIEYMYGKSLSEVLPQNYSVERFDLMLQIFDTTFGKEEVIPRMKFVWRSVAHAYLSRTEVKYILKKLVSTREAERRIVEICKDYDQVFIFSTMMPRSLKHYARTTFRTFYLRSDVIDNLDLPLSLKSYLKLE